MDAEKAADGDGASFSALELIEVQGRVKTLPYGNWTIGFYSALVVTEIRVLAISLNTL